MKKNTKTSYSDFSLDIAPICCKRGTQVSISMIQTASYLKGCLNSLPILEVFLKVHYVQFICWKLFKIIIRMWRNSSIECPCILLHRCQVKLALLKSYQPAALPWATFNFQYIGSFSCINCVLKQKMSADGCFLGQRNVNHECARTDLKQPLMPHSRGWCELLLADNYLLPNKCNTAFPLKLAGVHSLFIMWVNPM